MTQLLEEKPFLNEAAKSLNIKNTIQFVIRTGYISEYLEPSVCECLLIGF